jgi:hypothetical protein
MICKQGRNIGLGIVYTTNLVSTHTASCATLHIDLSCQVGRGGGVFPHIWTSGEAELRLLYQDIILLATGGGGGPNAKRSEKRKAKCCPHRKTPDE